MTWHLNPYTNGYTGILFQLQFAGRSRSVLRLIIPIPNNHDRCSTSAMDSSLVAYSYRYRNLHPFSSSSSFVYNDQLAVSSLLAERGGRGNNSLGGGCPLGQSFPSSLKSILTLRTAMMNFHKVGLGKHEMTYQTPFASFNIHAPMSRLTQGWRYLCAVLSFARRIQQHREPNSEE
jgi:hypothetical protein